MLISLVFWKAIFPAVEASVFQFAQEKQRTTSAQVADFIETRKNLLESLARNKILENGPTPEALAFLKMEQKHMSGIFEGLYYNELDGTVTPTTGSRFSVSDRPYFQRVREGEPVIGEVLTSRATQRRILLMVVPVVRDGEVVAALGGAVLLHDLFQAITPSRELQVALLQNDSVLEGFPEALGVNGEPSAYTSKGCRLYRGDTALRAWACELPLVPWRLVVAWPEREMLAPLYLALAPAVSSFVVILFLAAASSVVLQNSVTRPLQEAADILEQYRGDGALRLRTQGPREIAILLERINQMSDRVSQEMARRTDLEQQLAKAVHQERLGTLADSIAHDFNNVLSAIINLAELCQDDVEEESQTHDDLTSIMQSAQMGVSMVRQLREKAVSKNFAPETIIFDQEFENWEQTFRGLLPLRLSLKKNLRAEGVQVKAVPHHLFQVLLNLICNARDALAGQDSGEITVCSSSVGGRLTVEVKDNGPGVPMDAVPRVFEPFFTTRGDSGSGLGLSTCYRLVKELGGEIELIQGELTCFRISLPQAANCH
jgi:signal transduction histidine kinase